MKENRENKTGQGKKGRLEVTVWIFLKGRSEKTSCESDEGQRH